MIERVLKPGWTQVKFGDVVRLNKDRRSNPAAKGIERYVAIDWRVFLAGGVWNRGALPAPL